MLELNDQWPGFGIQAEGLENCARRLEGNEPWMQGTVSLYFEGAGRLLRLTRYEFFLLPFVFVQAVIGLEKLLRFRFDDEAGRLKLNGMMERALREGMLTDDVFSDVSPLDPRRLTGLRYLSERGEMRSVLIPKLRNEIVHGDYTLTPEFLPLALQVRAMAENIGVKPKNGESAAVP